VVDLHSLRHTYITMLVKGGVSAKVVQTLARHSTITLTMDRYAHLEVLDQRGALDVLPALGIPEESEALRGTGTEGASEIRTAFRTGAGCFSVHKGAQMGRFAECSEMAHPHQKMREIQNLHLVRPARFERAACGLGNRRSILLSYGRKRLMALGSRIVSAARWSRPTTAEWV